MAHDNEGGQIRRGADVTGVTNQPADMGGYQSPGGGGMSFADTSTNNKILFWASFLTLIAAGVGFSVRGAILGDWSKQFGFTQTELGTITGGGLVGFGITIILFSFIADWVGYKALMTIAFLFHFSSAVVTLAATYVSTAYGKDATYWTLWTGMFLYALGNGTCEAVINPLTADLFPRNKTHFLNILHAGWPGGLILGALLGLGFNYIGGVHLEPNGRNIWEIQMVLFLIPTLAYGILMFGRKFPQSHAAAAGVSIGTMLMEFAAPILLLLLVIHMMVGYVELGTDSWITNITGTILDNKNFGIMLFIWTSGLMFILRFFAGPIVHKISPIGLLFVSAILGCCGLLLLGQSTGAWLCILAATVYGFGKTFLWPTMLGVVSERYPRGGALTLGMIGGMGMLSAGLLGTPGIGYKQDYFASHYLQDSNPATYDRYKSDDKNSFLFFPAISGLDGQKVGVLGDDGKQLQGDLEILEKSGSLMKLKDIQKSEKEKTALTPDQDAFKKGDNWKVATQVDALNTWWEDAQKSKDKDKGPVTDARLYGGKMALTYTAFVPATMALCYLFLLLYFRAKGGYQANVLIEHGANDEKFTGGVEGPADL